MRDECEHGQLRRSCEICELRAELNGRNREVAALREASTNSKINTHKFLYSKGLGNGSLRVCDCFDSTSIECLGLSSDIEFLEKLLSLAKKYEE